MGSLKDPYRRKILKQCEFYINNVLRPRKCRCIKKSRHKINYRHFNPLRLPGVQRTPGIYFSQNPL